MNDLLLQYRACGAECRDDYLCSVAHDNMMRPELLMAHVGSLPSLSEVRESYRTIFPSVLGVRLSSGIRDSEFKKVMRDAAEIVAVDDARAGAMIGAMVRALQNDTSKDFGEYWQGTA